jgi:hypothetical protein
VGPEPGDLARVARGEIRHVVSTGGVEGTGRSYQGDKVLLGLDVGTYVGGVGVSLGLETCGGEIVG